MFRSSAVTTACTEPTKASGSGVNSVCISAHMLYSPRIPSVRIPVSDGLFMQYPDIIERNASGASSTPVQVDSNVKIVVKISTTMLVLRGLLLNFGDHMMYWWFNHGF